MLFFLHIHLSRSPSWSYLCLSPPDVTVGINPEAPAQYFLPLNGFHSQATLGIPFSDVSFGSFKSRSWPVENLTLV